MSASDPMFPLVGVTSDEDQGSRNVGCSKLLYAMIHSPNLSIYKDWHPVDEARSRRKWAEAIIKESTGVSSSHEKATLRRNCMRDSRSPAASDKQELPTGLCPPMPAQQPAQSGEHHNAAGQAAGGQASVSQSETLNVNALASGETGSPAPAAPSTLQAMQSLLDESRGVPFIERRKGQRRNYEDATVMYARRTQISERRKSTAAQVEPVGKLADMTSDAQHAASPALPVEPRPMSEMPSGSVAEITIADLERRLRVAEQERDNWMARQKEQYERAQVAEAKLQPEALRAVLTGVNVSRALTPLTDGEIRRIIRAITGGKP